MSAEECPTAIEWTRGLLVWVVGKGGIKGKPDPPHCGTWSCFGDGTPAQSLRQLEAMKLIKVTKCHYPLLINIPGKADVLASGYYMAERWLLLDYEAVVMTVSSKSLFNKSCARESETIKLTPKVTIFLCFSQN